MTSRVRCSCGRVYDPVKNTTCPDCGAESAVESVVVAEKVKPPAPPDLSREKEATKIPATDALTSLKTLHWAVYAGASLLLVFILFLLLRHHGPSSGQASGGSAAPQTHGESTPQPSAGESTPLPWATVPPSIPTFPSAGAMVTGTGNLAELIANPGPDGTVKLAPGIYQGGAVLNRAIHLVADSRMGGQVFIQTDGKECLTVRAKGVTVQGVQFMCNGIGELPAISVADGADLQMDGCKVQSSSALGVLVAGNASIKALGSSFTASNGAAVRVSKQVHASFTQCAFSDSKIELGIDEGAAVELHSCAFERAGMSYNEGAIMTIVGDKSQVTGDDCHFTNNSAGIVVSDKGSLELTKCEFKNNTASSARGNASTGVLVVRNSAHAVVRDTTMSSSSPYALNVMGGGTLTLEDSEVAGSRTAGLVVGERNGPTAQAQVKRSHFNRNSTGIGIYAGGSADIQESDCRENNEGIVVLDQGSHVKLTKTSLLSNRDHGLYVYGGAEAAAVDSQIENNARGAQSGQQHKSSMRASLILENCRVAGNQVFGVGACSQSQLSMNGVSFENNGKTNVYRESGAIVRTEAIPPSGQEQASASATPSPADSGSDAQHSSSRRKKVRRSDSDAAQLIRKLMGRP